MYLSSAQLATLRSWLNSNAIGLNDEDAINLLNATASPNYYVWRTNMRIEEIYDKITWVNFTPSDDPDSNVIWTNRSLACQGKQFNLQTMLIGSTGSLNPTKSGIRAGLNDATTNLPSGPAGTLRSGGWSGILTTLYRLCTVGEKLYSVVATGTGNNGANPRGDVTNPDALGIDGHGAYLEGLITIANVSEARQ